MDAVAMDERPAAGLRRKPAASVKVAAETVARGDTAAFFSAGHTGATVLSAHGALGKISKRTPAPVIRAVPKNSGGKEKGPGET